MSDAFSPYASGLTPQQSLERDAALQRLDVTLQGADPSTAALARAVVETMFYTTLHLDSNTRQYVIAQREALRDDITAAMGVMDRGLGVSMGINEQTIVALERMSARIGAPPAEDERSLMDRMASAERSRERQGQAIRALFLLFALTLFFAIATLIALFYAPAAAAMISAASVIGGVAFSLRPWLAP